MTFYIAPVPREFLSANVCEYEPRHKAQPWSRPIGRNFPERPEGPWHKRVGSLAGTEGLQLSYSIINSSHRSPPVVVCLVRGLGPGNWASVAVAYAAKLKPATSHLRAFLVFKFHNTRTAQNPRTIQERQVRLPNFRREGCIASARGS